jgi:prevent-host-death family protein
MREIGIGELKMKLSSVIRRVERGERVRVTRRGRPVADVVPVDSPEEAQGGPERSEAMKKLIAEGRVTPGVRSRTRRKPRPRDAGISGTAIILAEREEER